MLVIKSDTVFLVVLAIVLSVLAIAAFLPLLAFVDLFLNAGCIDWECV